MQGIIYDTKRCRCSHSPLFASHLNQTRHTVEGRVDYRYRGATDALEGAKLIISLGWLHKSHGLAYRISRPSPTTPLGPLFPERALLLCPDRHISQTNINGARLSATAFCRQYSRWKLLRRRTPGRCCYPLGRRRVCRPPEWATTTR